MKKIWIFLSLLLMFLSGCQGDETLKESDKTSRVLMDSSNTTRSKNGSGKEESILVSSKGKSFVKSTEGTTEIETLEVSTENESKAENESIKTDHSETELMESSSSGELGAATETHGNATSKSTEEQMRVQVDTVSESSTQTGVVQETQSPSTTTVPASECTSAEVKESETTVPETMTQEKTAHQTTTETTAETTANPTVTPVDTNAYATMVIQQLNLERTTNGLTVLSVDSELMAYAAVRAQECSILFSHERPDGSKALVSTESLLWVFAENCHSGGEPNVCISGWMSSEMHKNNILSDATHIGVGCYQAADGCLYYTAEFGMAGIY